MNKKNLIIALLILTTTMPQIGFAAKKQQQTQMPPAIVTTTTAKQVTYQPQITATGSLAAMQGITVRPEIPGRITQIYFKSGENIQKGKPLVQINPDVYKAKLLQAQAQLNLTTLSYQRAARLFKTHAVAQSDLDQTLDNMRSAQGALNAAQAQLDQSLIKAPFSGLLGLRQISVGDYVSAGQALVNLQALDPIRVDFSVPQVYLHQLALKQNVTITSDSYPGKTFTGKIYAFDSLVDTNTRSLDVRAEIANPQHQLLPGLFVEVTAFIGKAQAAVQLPQTAVMYDAIGPYVYKADKGVAHLVRVTLGHRDAQNVIITKGIKAGETIISSGQLKVHDNGPIMVSPQHGK